MNIPGDYVRVNMGVLWHEYISLCRENGIIHFIIVDA